MREGIRLEYAHITKDERKKMKPCINGYRLYDTEKFIVFYSRDVIFYESRSIVERIENKKNDGDKKKTFCC